MIIIGIANQKGGVGKTTTTHNFGAGLAKKGKRVLMIDLDAQGNLTDACGLQSPFDLVALLKEGKMPPYPSTLDILAGTPIKEVIKPVKENLDLVPGNIFLASADMKFADAPIRHALLENAIKPIRKNYDFLLLDCPPNLGLIAQNAFRVMSHLLIPVQCEYLSLVGLTLTEYSIDQWRKHRLLNHKFQIVGILPTFLDLRKNLVTESYELLKDMRKDLVLNTAIRDNIHLAEAPAHNQDIFAHSPNSYGAKDYEAALEETLQRLNLT